LTEITEERIHHLKSSILRIRQYLNFSNSLSQKPIIYSSKKTIKGGDIILKKVKSTENLDNKKETNIEKKNKKIKSENVIDGKITLLPGDCAVSQGDEGNTAYLIISGSFNVEIDKKVVGAMSPGEIFGELSLILGEKRKATVRAITGSELIEINPNFLDEYLLNSKTDKKTISSSTLETQKIIKALSVELGKKEGHNLPIDITKLDDVLKNETHIIRSLAIQLHKRLSRMISDNKKRDVK
tara:strand:+ start:174 stop:896 length:723 start_codon:yes stop_codon:yes gene_type:complete